MQERESIREYLISKDIVLNNVPEILLPAIKQMVDEGGHFYLSSNNYNRYHGEKIFYSYSYLVSADPWSAYSKKDENYIQEEVTPNQQRYIAAALFNPSSIKTWSMHLTPFCNISCPMCPFHGKEGDAYKAERKKMFVTVPLETAFERIKKIADFGATHLSLTPLGELFMYKHWREVIKYAKELGLHVGFTSNGTLLTRERCRELAELGIDSLTLSIDAINFDTYAKVHSSKKEYYETAINAPETLREFNIETGVHFVRQPENLKDENEFINYYTNKGFSVGVGEYLEFIDGKLLRIKREEIISNPTNTSSSCNNYQPIIQPDGKIVFCCALNHFQFDDNRFNIIEHPHVDDGIEHAVAWFKKHYICEKTFDSICSTCALWDTLAYTQYTMNGIDCKKARTNQTYNKSVGLMKKWKSRLVHAIYDPRWAVHKLKEHINKLLD